MYKKIGESMILVNISKINQCNYINDKSPEL